MWYVEEREAFGSGYRTVSVSVPLSKQEAKDLRDNLTAESGEDTWFVLQREINVEVN